MSQDNLTQATSDKNTCDFTHSQKSKDFTMSKLYFTSQDNTSTLLDPKLEVIDSNTPLFFINSPTPPRDIQLPASQPESTGSHVHHYNSIPLSDLHQPTMNNFISPNLSSNFVQNGYLEFINGTDNNMETNVTPNQVDQQIQDVDDKGNLQIRVLGVPQTGAKSRVETQIKLCLQLVTDKGEKVPLWSHLRLPEYMVAKEKLKTKNSRHSPDSAMNISDKGVLNLEATVVCASEMPKKVLTCLGCVQRERKRSQRKKENKHSKTNQNSTSPSNDTNKHMELDDEKTMQLEQRKILLFNCSEIVDFSSGDTILPTRITCYCRHHNEKVGFCIYFVMKDYTNAVIATGMSPPIMITDDHKSSKTKVGVGRKRARSEYDRRTPAIPNLNSENKLSNGHNGRNMLSTLSTTPPTSETSLPIISPNAVSVDSSSRTPSPPVTIVPTQNSNMSLQHPIIKQEDNKNGNQQLQLQSTVVFQASPSPTSPISPVSPTTPLLPFQQQVDQNPNISSTNQQVAYPIASNNVSPNVVVNLSMAQTTNNMNNIYQQQQLHQNVGNVNRFNVSAAPSHQVGGGPMRIHANYQNNNMLRRTFYTTTGNATNIYQNNTINGFPIPRISRLIPSEGPTYGGVEVTVLGNNFYDGLTCVFGETPVIPTQYWSPNALVCILPPCPTPGPVVVSFKEYPINLLENPEQEVVIFTYTDDSDRVLMELALQVVGMKMTGKVEDARNIAMRIVGGNDSSSNSSVNNANGNMNTMQNHFSSYARQVSMSQNFEEHIIATLSLMDVIETEYYSISLRNRQEHTLLHLATMLGYKRLCEIVIERNIDVGAQDKYGFTALHYAAWAGHEEIVRMLLNVGCVDIPNLNDQYASDLAMSRNFNEISALIADRLHDSGVSLSPTSEESSFVSTDDDGFSDEDFNIEDNQEQRPLFDVQNPNNKETSDSVETEENVNAPNISWVDSETARDLLQNKVNKEDGIVDAEVVEDEKKPSKQPLSEIATDLATASSIWLQKTFAHMYMPNISKPPIPLPNIKMPNLQNFSSPKFSTMTFGTNLSIPRPSIPSIPSLSNLEFPTLPTVTFPTMIMPVVLSSFVKDEKNESWGEHMTNMVPSSWDNCKKMFLGQGGQPQPQQPQTGGESSKNVGQDPSTFSRFGYAWPFYASQPVVPMYHHQPEISRAPSPSVNISRASRRVGYDLQDLNEDQKARLEVHDEKFKQLKKDRMLYLFWVPTLWVMIALAIVQYNPFSMGEFIIQYNPFMGGFITSLFRWITG
ncbi:hypothetical protein Glove_578g31 [Diversispora epigaea]|uniref:IPT/TIG domain-containing protein n=1 Tax=Diversispora epigaea TaxID=1348612 RepID=A0A397GD30_9GLOM|nr:hypothetical protein Glove_578g31 [Diversispora epigaea]